MLWEIPKTHFSVAHALLDLPVVQGRAPNPYLLWQSAFGASPPPTGEEDKSEEAREAALEQRNLHYRVPDFRQLRAGHELGTRSGTVVCVDLMRGGERTTLKLDAAELVADATDLEEMGHVSVIFRKGRLLVVLKLVTVAAGKSQLRPFGGISHRRHAVVSEARKGSLSVCVTSAGVKHVLWTDETSSAIEDDIVVNSDFIFDRVKRDTNVLMLHNKSARGRPPSSEVDDFFHNGRPRDDPADPKGEFKALYWLQSRDEMDAVLEQLNAAMAAVQGVRPLLAKMDRFVNEHMLQQVAEEIAVRPQPDASGSPSDVAVFEAPRMKCTKCHSNKHFAWQCHRATK
jgi:hypothetical protein